MQRLGVCFEFVTAPELGVDLPAWQSGGSGWPANEATRPRGGERDSSGTFARSGSRLRHVAAAMAGRRHRQRPGSGQRRAGKISELTGAGTSACGVEDPELSPGSTSISASMTRCRTRARGRAGDQHGS